MVLKRAVVTGASGMVGRHLLELLAGQGITVAASSRSHPETLPGDATWRSWDLAEWRDEEELDSLFGPADVVFHVGAAVPAPGVVINERVMIDANVRACRCLGNWAMVRGIPLIFLSGAVVYGPGGRAPFNEEFPLSHCPEGGLYGLTKVLAEQILENLVPSGLKLARLRATSIYGTGLSAAKLLPSLLRRAMEGETIRLAPPVEDTVNLVHAADVARAMLMAASAEADGPFNIGGPEMVSVRRMAEACVETAGNGAVEIGDVVSGVAERPPAARFNVDCRAAAEKFGFLPEIALSEGLRRMMGGLYL